MTPNEQLAYWMGVTKGIWLYAHWKDGVPYVGTTGRTLEEAQRDVATKMSKLVLMHDILSEDYKRITEGEPPI